jgi:hypothetical protein
MPIENIDYVLLAFSELGAADKYKPYPPTVYDQ